MREGNCCDRCKAGVWNDTKSYAVASWQDYVEWCNRLGYHATWSHHNRTLTVITDEGETLHFTEKRDVFYFLLGEEYDCE